MFYNLLDSTSFKPFHPRVSKVGFSIFEFQVDMAVHKIGISTKIKKQNGKHVDPEDGSSVSAVCHGI